MQVTWVMDTNLGQQSDIRNYVNAVLASGAKVIEVNYIPFSQELPVFEVDGAVIFYGSVGFIQQVQKTGKWPTGIFSNHETFTYDAWAQNYNEMLLNSPDAAKTMLIKDFSIINKDPDEYIFVRPQHDTKSIVGSVWTNKDFDKWCTIAKQGILAGVDENTPIVVAKPYGIEAEWRLFVVDNCIVASSQYQKNRKLYKKAGAPEEVIAFAEKAIKRWSPSVAYVLDICRTAGNLFIVEAQGFNSAGTYSSDILAIAQSVNSVAMRLYLESNIIKTAYK